MFKLTRQQQLFLCTMLFFLLLGWIVRAWRTAHLSSASAVSSTPAVAE